MLQHLGGIFHDVERLERFLAPPRALLGFALGLRFLDARRIRQQVFEQAVGRFGRPDRFAIAKMRQARQQPGMVDMGVGEQQIVDLPGVERKRLVVEVADGLVALKHTAIDEKLPPVMHHPVA